MQAGFAGAAIYPARMAEWLKNFNVAGEMELNMKQEKVKIYTDYIKLCQFLKFAADTGGGEADVYIREGNVSVNGAVETQRGKKIRSGDKIVFEETEYTVV